MDVTSEVRPVQVVHPVFHAVQHLPGGVRPAQADLVAKAVREDLPFHKVQGLVACELRLGDVLEPPDPAPERVLIHVAEGSHRDVDSPLVVEDHGAGRVPCRGAQATLRVARVLVHVPNHELAWAEVLPVPRRVGPAPHLVRSGREKVASVDRHAMVDPFLLRQHDPLVVRVDLAAPVRVSERDDPAVLGAKRRREALSDILAAIRHNEVPSRLRATDEPPRLLDPMAGVL
mmetsp:Transcript_11224/g.34248  ORF Transcript_11224/g.34248 Transcript_11224/m.34248 type:complete len:231 (-) Transcript_11224:201-893(-)